MFAYILLIGLASSLSKACIECPFGDDDNKGKSSFYPIPDEDDLRVLAFTSRGLLEGVSRLHPTQQLQIKARSFYPKSAVQRVPSALSAAASPPLQPTSSSAAAVRLPPNLPHLYTMLNKGFAADTHIDDYYLQDLIPGATPRRIAKKAEKGMMVDVMDYVSKSEDRNRRVGQNMRSSG